MPERIVVAFRWVGLAGPAAGSSYLERALALKKRAAVHGATLCAWSAQTFAFELLPEDLEEALSLASVVTEDEAVPRDARFAVGVSIGALAPIGEAGSFATLAWGTPLVQAVELARLAQPGEVRLGPEVLPVDAEAPLELDASDLCDDVAHEDSAPPTVQTASAPPDLRGPVDLVEQARRALVRRDIAALEGLLTRMRVAGDNDELVERMSAMVALGRGAKAEALSSLRQAAEAPELAPAHRPRARLAYAVALAAAGRPESALLEALTALARARELLDTHGEHACARFLARLSAATGHASAASTWARVARMAADPPGGEG